MKNNNVVQQIFVSVFLTLILFSPSTHAVTLSLDPASQIVTPSGTASVDLNISGLGNFAAPSLGAFLVEITLDSNILSFDSVSYGSFLGDPLDSSETDIITTVGAGSVSLDEFSFLFDFELNALQPSSFTLATLAFSGNNIGTSSLGFGAIDISDAVGSTINPVLEEATVTVIPLPAAFPLFLSALGCLVLWFSRIRRMSPPVVGATLKRSFIA